MRRAVPGPLKVKEGTAKLLADPKKTRLLVRRLARRWSSGPRGSSRFRVERVEQAKKGARRMVVITCSGSSSGYYNPLESVAKMLSDARDPSRVPSQVRELDPASVTPSEKNGSKHSTWAHASVHLARMKKISGHFITCWMAGPVQSGRLYLYPDKVLYQCYEPATGWTNLRIPEEGLDWNAARRTP